MQASEQLVIFATYSTTMGCENGGDMNTALLLY